MKNKCAVIIVTYNRIELLKENIEALRNQVYSNFDIIIIDNASTDGTGKMVKAINDKRIKYYNTKKNLGGAGGFSIGMKMAIENSYDFAWLMDDDAIPEKNALNSLILKANNLQNQFSFLASLVCWTDNSVIDMNIPSINFEKQKRQQLESLLERKALLIDTCSFVGCFVNIKYAKKTVLPISDFFIYGDDVEYTSRLRKMAPAYLDLDSVIIHKTISNIGSDIALVSKDKIFKFYYQSRNGMYMARKNRKILKRLLVVLKRLAKILLKAENCKVKRCWVLIRGTCAGFLFNPKIQKADEKRGNINE